MGWPTGSCAAIHNDSTCLFSHQQYISAHFALLLHQCLLCFVFSILPFWLGSGEVMWFCLHFPDGWWSWVTFHVFLYHMYFIIENYMLMSLTHCVTGFLISLLSFMSSLHILKSNPLSACHKFANIFPNSLGWLWFMECFFCCVEISELSIVHFVNFCLTAYASYVLF